MDGQRAEGDEKAGGGAEIGGRVETDEITGGVEL